MQGLVMKFVGRTRNIIKELLNGIEVSNFDFDMQHWESYGDDIYESKYDFSNIKNVNYQVVKSKIFLEDNYVCPEFMELFIRKSGTVTSEIITYRDFIESEYILAIISYDYRNVEIVCKDSRIIEIIKENFINLGVKEKRIEEVYDIPFYAQLKAWRQGIGINE